mmetsp:Transcript_33594/g.68684  ORF Transcript_33594/g.68684 Transcript_33594/m.68684 type:complete len:293 (-) Transcript_33594:286-1164(-)|eukprot:CAMPEP_0171610804 /NCGR_PEP_ID=MMETSP0990-20121206/10264_1 /TAXON_ID=483369 /ORGANISM="non described non described, Strain CCMP2098" /LENGTH=292 /DNA_ID=CAMNT_0012174277 /DNA_START=19 /DNA_END=897 /DNA_ORIENTATION=-
MDTNVALPESVCPVDSPFQLTRLNGDTSWLLEASGTRIVLDPWLKGIEIDFFRWFNIGKHSVPEVSDVASLGHIDGILVSLPFSDHCHEESLDLFPATIPIYVANGAAKRVRAHFGSSRTIIDVPSFFKSKAAGEDTPGVLCGALCIGAFPPPGFPDLAHGGLVLTTSAAPGCLVYAPHGIKPSPRQVAAIERAGTPLLLLSTSTRVSFLGSTCNMGLGAAEKLVGMLKAHAFIETHSEHNPEGARNNNAATGVACKFTSVEYATPKEVRERIPVAQFAASPTSVAPGGGSC